MKMWESLHTALSNVISHKMRSLLTMLGIIIGISSVMMITAVGAGVKNAVFQTISSVNQYMIEVYAQSISSWEDQLTLEDAQAISELKNVSSVSSVSERWGQKLQLRVPGKIKEGSIVGTDQNYRVIEETKISIGRFISESDVENHSYVTVIRPDIAIEVFGRINCLGEKIEIETWNGKVELTVIGILRSGEDNVVSDMLNTPMSRSLAMAPITTLNDVFFSENIVDFMGVSIKDPSQGTSTAEKITNLLNTRHNREKGYRAESMDAMFDEIDGVLSAITGFVAFVAAISLFVGGVGVMNVMLVTVKERTREIGVRKSLGATNSNIQFQFILEAMILTALGGGIGIILGGLGAKGIGLIISTFMRTQVTPAVSVVTTGIAFGVSSLVGIIFGVYPAGKAAKLDPIEALRYE